MMGAAPGNAPPPRCGSPSRRRVGELSEDELVSLLTRSLPGSPGVILGAGDDCAAVLPEAPGAAVLLKADALVEGVHFLREHPPAAVGWKALARAVSDIAAMAGQPAHALVTAAFPEDLPLAYALGIYTGVRRCAKAFRVAVVGGETSRSPSGIFLSVALAGRAAAGRLVSRAGGRDGDCLWVTGKLGGSYASGKHLRFRPRLAEALWLAENFLPSAMMDLSDGLASDLPRLAARSGLGFFLDVASLPLSEGCSADDALRDGEDYELLFALDQERSSALPAAWEARFPRVPLTKIGRLSREGVTRLDVMGYQHFSG